MINVIINKIYAMICAISVIGMLLSGVSEAAVNPRDAGHPEAVDFTYKGLALGDGVEVMRKLLGEPDYDTDISLFGQELVRYTYSRELRVWTDKASSRVVQIDVNEQKKYRARNDVTYGATRYLLYRTYGEAERRMVDGKIYFIYVNPDNPKQRLCIDMDPTNYYLKGFIITTLPLDEEEYLLRKGQEELVAQEEQEASEPAAGANTWHRPFQTATSPKVPAHTSEAEGAAPKAIFGSGGNF